MQNRIQSALLRCKTLAASVFYRLRMAPLARDGEIPPLPQKALICPEYRPGLCPMALKIAQTEREAHFSATSTQHGAGQDLRRHRGCGYQSFRALDCLLRRPWNESRSRVELRASAKRSPAPLRHAQKTAVWWSKNGKYIQCIYQRQNQQ